jgi:hypothetical protein
VVALLFPRALKTKHSFTPTWIAICYGFFVRVLGVNLYVLFPSGKLCITLYTSMLSDCMNMSIVNYDFIGPL